MAPAAPSPIPDPELADGLVRLRRWRVDDLDCIREAATDPGIPAGTTVPADFTVADGLGFVYRQWSRAERGEGLSLAVADAATGRGARPDRAAAAAAAGRRRPRLLGHPPARGRGLATRAAALLSSWALAGGGFARVEAWAEPANVASQRVLLGAGFAREGVLRSFLSFGDRRADAVVFARTAA